MNAQISSLACRSTKNFHCINANAGFEIVMKKSRYIITGIIVLIVLNYTLYPIVFPTPPSNLDIGGKFAQDSSNFLDDKFHIYNLVTSETGYALLSSKTDLSSLLLSYYDLDHNLLWDENLTHFEDYSPGLYGTDQYLSVIDRFGSILGSHETIVNDTTSLYQYVDYRDPRALTYNLFGDLISNFSIQLCNITKDDIANNITKIPLLKVPIIQKDTIYIIEYQDVLYPNSSGTACIYLHAYDLHTGELKWHNIIRKFDFTVGSPQHYEIIEYTQVADDKQVLLLKSYSDDLILNKYSISMDSNGITDVEEEIKTYKCLHGCTDFYVLSFDEVIGISSEIMGEERIYSFISSKGYRLNVSTSYWTNPKHPKDRDSGMKILDHYLMNSNTLALSGTISTIPNQFRHYFGFLTSDGKLELNLIDMNNTHVHSVRSVDDNTFLSINHNIYSNEKTVVLWSLTMIEIIDWLNPYPKHILPLLLIILIIFIIYLNKLRGSKVNKKSY